jgi:hypothetical protein
MPLVEINFCVPGDFLLTAKTVAIQTVLLSSLPAMTGISRDGFV